MGQSGGLGSISSVHVSLAYGAPSPPPPAPADTEVAVARREQPLTSLSALRLDPALRALGAEVGAEGEQSPICGFEPEQLDQENPGGFYVR